MSVEGIGVSSTPGLSCVFRSAPLRKTFGTRLIGIREGGDAMSHAPNISYALEPDLPAAEFRDVLIRSTLGERRPVHDLPRLDAMLRNADVIVTARIDGLLVGVSRAITDFSFATYLSDLAVDAVFQKRGIGRELIARTHAEAGRQTLLVLLAAPAARTYYPHIGMSPHESCWIIDRQS